MVAVADEKATPVTALRLKFLSTSGTTLDQASKLGLSTNRTIVSMYSNYQVGLTSHGCHVQTVMYRQICLTTFLDNIHCIKILQQMCTSIYFSYLGMLLLSRRQQSLEVFQDWCKLCNGEGNTFMQHVWNA